LSLHVRNEYDIRMAIKRIKSHSVPEGDSTDKTNGATATESEEEHNSQYVPDDMDPASLQTTLSSLLPHDELMQQMKAGKAFHEGWKEGPIRFLPSYKYDVGTVAVFDSSEKKRGPSWCDRILYRTRADFQAYRKKVQDSEKARLRDEELAAKGIDGDENVIFDYLPEEDGETRYRPPEPETETVKTREGLEDQILLEHYASHQRVLSSDHKPMTAVFSLTYQSVMHEKKAQIESEIRRELDKRQNELRPIVTIALDRMPVRKETETTQTVWPEDVIDFGPVVFSKERRISAMIANIGQVPAVLSLVDRPTAGLGEEGPTPPWLTVQFDHVADLKDKKAKGKEPATYTLQPGEACSVDFIVKIDTPELAKDLNDGVVHLDDILIMRVENGRDHFLPVVGKWQQSSIDRMKNSLRKLQSQKPTGGSD
jgi:phosphatidylinositol-bisphosphatase